MAVKAHGELNLSIAPETMLSEDETMLVLGNIHDIQKCFHI